MNKKPLKVILISILGLLISLWNFLEFDNSNKIFLVISLIYLSLSIGIFLLINWVRIITILFSLYSLFIYLQLLYYGIKGIVMGGKNMFIAAGFIFHLPSFIFALLVLDTLTRKKIKEIFK